MRGGEGIKGYKTVITSLSQLPQKSDGSGLGRDCLMVLSLDVFVFVVILEKV